MRALLSCCIFVFAFAVFGNNPLGFREYRQKVVISCATPEDAARVQLSPNGLPKDYKLAVSARWDDSAIEHLRTQEVMRKNGIRGTFFLNTVTRSRLSEKTSAARLFYRSAYRYTSSAAGL